MIYLQLKDHFYIAERITSVERCNVPNEEEQPVQPYRIYIKMSFCGQPYNAILVLLFDKEEARDVAFTNMCKVLSWEQSSLDLTFVDDYLIN